MRNGQPYSKDWVYLTDGGMETTFIFHHGIDLPEFAAFVLLQDSAGIARLKEYYTSYLALAARYGKGFVLDSPTWRASADWGAKLGFDRGALDDVNRRAIRLMAELREDAGDVRVPLVVSGVIGPRGDGYKVADGATVGASADYHRTQIQSLRDAGAEVITAYTITTPAEAQGIADAAADAGIPAVVSFTVETDGRLPDGQPLAEAIDAVDGSCKVPPAFYMVNCAHPDHLNRIEGTGSWRGRIGGLRVNASRRSHAELDESTSLDEGEPRAIGEECYTVAARFPSLKVVGGCCGTDLRHLESIAQAWSGSSSGP